MSREPKEQTLPDWPFMVTAVPALDEIEKQIDLLLGAQLIDSYAHAIYRLYISTLRDATTRPADRMKAIEGLAKLRGLFVQVIRKTDEDLADKPTHELLKALMQQMNLPLSLAEPRPGRSNGKIAAPPPVRALEDS